MKKLTPKNWLIEVADDFSDLLTTVVKEPPHPDFGSDVSRNNSQGSWSGVSWHEALKLAREGWKEGRENLTRELDAANILNLSATVRAEKLDVAGSFPLVPAAVAGDPLNMFTIGLERAKTRPIFRFIVNLSTSATVSGSYITNRGAAVLSWVDKLENDGARCEIIVIWASKCGVKAPNNQLLWVPVKRADEPLDVDRMAFVLTHPSMLRRICFAATERHPELKHFNVGYGAPSDDIHDSLKIPHSIYFDCLGASKAAPYATRASAIAHVGEIISKAQQQEDLEDAA